jgi:hypothetical protein
MTKGIKATILLICSFILFAVLCRCTSPKVERVYESYLTVFYPSSSKVLYQGYVHIIGWSSSTITYENKVGEINSLQLIPFIVTTNKLKIEEK